MTRTRTRIGLALATAIAGGTGLLGLTACGLALDGNGASNSSTAGDAAAGSAEGQVLAAMGYSADLGVDDPSTAPSGQATEPGRRRAARVILNRRMLHGEATVQTRDGAKVVTAQRGTVTAVDGTTVTVKSGDGFTLTWTIGDPIHVWEHRQPADLGAVKTGTEVGVAGAREGDTVTARLIVIPEKS